MLFEAEDRVLRQEAREEATVIDFDRSCDLGHPEHCRQRLQKVVVYPFVVITSYGY
jgi:hypothetical protein